MYFGRREQGVLVFGDEQLLHVPVRIHASTFALRGAVAIGRMP